MGHGSEGYYLELTRADYYTGVGEPPGRWLGRGAEQLGLRSPVAGRDLRAAFAGFAPDGRPLVRNAGAASRQPGWDLTFSAPKTVSVFWAVAADAHRREVRLAHAEAVRAAVGFLEDAAGRSRVGRGGRRSVRVGLVVAAFEHGASRAGDPGLHTHALLLNLGVDDAGFTRTILSRPLYDAKMVAGAVYRTELAYQLRHRLGLETTPCRTWFEIAGVPEAAVDVFSKRRSQIMAELAAAGRSDPRAAAAAALKTRPAKLPAREASSFDRWRAEAGAVGFGRAAADALLRRGAPVADPRQRLTVAVRAAASGLADRRGHFTEVEFVRAVAETVQADGVAAADVMLAARTFLAGSPEIVRLGAGSGAPRFTTRELFAVERQLLETAATAAKSSCEPAPDEVVAAAIGRRPFLHPEQVAALRHLTCGTGRLRVIDGLAGTGKTTLLAAAREAWEGGGWRVIGAALAGQAAQGLQAGSGIPAATVHRRLLDLDAGRLVLTDRTVLVVDEAGMIGTRLLARVAVHARRADTLLVLVGDRRQLQSPVEAGGGFAAIGGRVGRAELAHITRQRERWAADAVRAVVAGNPMPALRAFADRGLLTVAEDRTAAACALAADWAAAGGVKDPVNHLILAGTNREAAVLNAHCRRERWRAGLLGGPSVRLDTVEFAAGDRVLFTRNSRPLGVTNGSLGTVCRTDPGRSLLVVRLDSGAVVAVPLADYPHVRPGYAVTTHKAQGATAAHAYVLAGGPMTDRELAYVQLSRAREGTRVYTDRLSAGDDLAELTRGFARTRRDRLAHDAARGELSSGPELSLSDEVDP